MTEPLSLKRCSKGRSAVLSFAPYPYPLIQAKSESLVDIPHLCDTTTDGGGWILIQRRATGDIDFHRGWDEYRTGFGDLRGDFWLGLDPIHTITSSGPCELRVEMIYQGRSVCARYGRFYVSDAAHNYQLGTAWTTITEKSLPPL